MSLFINYGVMAGKAEKILSYYGTTTSLSKARYHISSANVGNYILFGGGEFDDSAVNTVDAYSSLLTRTTPTALNSTSIKPITASVGNYALFMKSTLSSAYNTSLTRSITSSVIQIGNGAGTTLGNYAIFGGGWGTLNNVVHAYDTSLVRTALSSLSILREKLSATSIGNYALFGGGERIEGHSGASAVVDAYNTSLVRSTATNLNSARRNLTATTVGSYAIFGGGSVSSNSTMSANVDAYNDALTRTTPTSLGVYGSSSITSTTIDKYALFIGLGAEASQMKAYNESLQQTSYQLNNPAHYTEAGTVGNFALIAGGIKSGAGTLNVVDVFQVS